MPSSDHIYGDNRCLVHPTMSADCPDCAAELERAMHGDSNAAMVTLRHEKSGADVDLPTDVVLDLLADYTNRYQVALTEAAHALRMLDQTPLEDDDVRAHWIGKARSAVDGALNYRGSPDV